MASFSRIQLSTSSFPSLSRLCSISSVVASLIDCPCIFTVQFAVLIVSHSASVKCYGTFVCDICNKDGTQISLFDIFHVTIIYAQVND